MDEAWAWYKAMLRSSRHVGRHGVLIERLIGAADFHDSADSDRALGRGPEGRVLHSCAGHWLMRSTPTRLSVPLSDTMKLDYLVCLSRPGRAARDGDGDSACPAGPMD